MAVLLVTADLRCCKHGASLVDSCSKLVARATAGAARPAALAVAMATSTVLHVCISACCGLHAATCRRLASVLEYWMA